MNQSVIVVGAGIAGLVCARRLHQAGIQVTIVEHSNSIGGRLSTETVDGYRLDGGSQFFSSSYPNTKLELNYKELNLRDIEPGCYVWTGKRLNVMHKDHPLEMVFSKHKQINMSDVFRLRMLLKYASELSERDVWNHEERTTRSFLIHRGFSEDALEDFFEPFFSSIFLNRDLNESCRAFLFELKAAQTSLCIPSQGMGAIAEQVAGDIPWDRYLLDRKATSLLETNGRVIGVKLDDGQTLKSDWVVVSTNAKDASALTGLPTFAEHRSCATVHFATQSSPVEEKMIVTNETGGGRINHVIPVSLICPDAAPSGHLVSATILGNATMLDIDFADSLRYELASWFPDAQTQKWRPLRVDRTTYARMAQPSGFQSQVTQQSPRDGLLFAGEHTAYAGLDGAIRSGQDAAIAVMRSDSGSKQA